MEGHRNTQQLPPISPGHHLLKGTALVFMADALFPLTGIVTSAFLTRNLGAGYYGLLTLCATLISWIEISIGALFSRATVKIVGEADDWRPIGAALLRLHILVGIGAMAACWILAKPCAMLLGEPELAEYLTLFAVDIPIFALANCHRSILIGKRRYAERAMLSAGRWLARLAFIIILVQLGLSLRGAILGMIGASVVELAIARYHIRPPWTGKNKLPVSLWNYAVPILLATMSMRFINMDLFILKGLGASAAQAGIYGASQNVSLIMPGIFSAAFSPLLLSTIIQVLREGDLAAASILGRNTIRIVLAMGPVAAIAAAASDEIAVLLFGAHFAGAGPLIEILVFAGLSMTMINLLSSVLIAWERPAWPLKIAAPLIPVAIAGHLLAIPRFGPAGAASVTAIMTGLGALASVFAVKRLLKIDLPVVTLVRALLLSGMAYASIHYWPTHGPAIIARIAIALVLVAAGFFALGEFRHDEVKFFRAIIRQYISRFSPGNP